MSDNIEITEARVKYKNGFIDKVEVLIPDGNSYKAYAASRQKTSGFYSLEEWKNLDQTIIENTAKYGFKISAVHHFPNYFN